MTPPLEDRSLRDALEVDSICLRFEQQWQSGAAQPIHTLKQFLIQGADSVRGRLFRELVLIELEWRRRHGEMPRIDEYDAAFPDRRAELAEIQQAPGTTVAVHSKFSTSLSEPSSTDHGRFLPGTCLLGRYRIISLIGRGAMGEVYRADDLKLAQPVALKFLPARLQHDSRRLEYFLNEVRVARQVSHPNVCRVYDIGEIDGHHFLSMEFIDGEDLRGLIRRIGRLPADKGRQIAQQLCAGLAAAHDRGVLHRDLKPANIMIDGRGQARITDFGLARVVEDGRGAEGGGTPQYMAPEQLARNKTSAQSDLYALGLVLYEMFTGELPHRAKSIEELIAFHESPVPPIPSNDVDVVVESVILHCLEREPERRPRSARAVAASLPGGDPLEAAVQSNETPSPEIVAAGGVTGTLRPRTALAAWIAICASLVGAMLLADFTSLVAFVPIKPPEVLVDASESMLHDLGWDTRGGDSAYGFAYSAPSGQGDIRERRDALHFWYRYSPSPLAALRIDSFGRVSETDPPLVVPGMVRMQLDGLGRMLEFVRIPETDRRVLSSELAAPRSDWTGVLAAQTGLPLDQFTVTDSPWVPPVFCDDRATWIPSPTIETAVEVERVEAAFLEDRPVYVRVVFPWSTPSSLAPRPAPRARFALVVQYAVYYGLSALAAGFAWHNVRLGRSDRRGAFRLAVFYLVAQWFGWLFQVDHLLAAEEWRILVYATGEALFQAVRAWVVYLALEPFVRRLWPQSLVSWNRLLLGRWRDPMVGRDVLIGLLLGLPCLYVLQSQGMVAHWLGLGDPKPYWVFEPVLRDAGSTAGAILGLPMTAFSTVIVIFFSFFLLRWILKTSRRAIIAFVLAWTLLITVLYPGHPVLSLMLAIPLPFCMAFLLSRYGLLAAVAFMLTQYLQIVSPLTADVSRWYFDHGLVGVLAFAALAAYAFHTSLGGQGLFPAGLPRS